MRLLLVRHAETDANVSGTLQGHADNPLSARGQRQAVLIGGRLKEREIDVAYSSDLKRACQTALAIIQGRNIPIHFDPRLRERSYGVFQGRPVSDFQAAFESTGLSRDEFRPDGGESYRDVDVRSVEFLKEIIHRHRHATVLVVSHSGTNRVLLRNLLRRSFSEALQIEQENTCFNELSVLDDQVNLLTMNCIEHLKDEKFAKLGIGE